MIFTVRVFSIAEEHNGTDQLVASIKDAINSNEDLPFGKFPVSVEFPNGESRNSYNMINAVTRIFQKDDTSQEEVDLAIGIVADEIQRFAEKSATWCEKIHVHCEVPRKGFTERILK